MLHLILFIIKLNGTFFFIIQKHLFRSEENLKSDACKKPNVELPLQRIHSNSINSLNVSMSVIEQRDKSKLGQSYLNAEYLREYMVAFLRFFQKQSYLLSLISMMARLYIFFPQMYSQF